jgi:arylsulfatase A-like enzyme
MDHQYSVCDTLARVPLIVVRRGVFREGTTITKQVQAHDVFPTVLDLLQLDGAAREQHQGQSLLDGERESTVIEYLSSAHEGIARRFPDVDLTWFRRTFRAIRTDQYKFIHASDGGHELYDLVADPGEQANLIESLPEVARTLSGKLNEWVFHHERTEPDEMISAQYDKDIEERLRNLGYL